jgi:hypothetical protein
MKEFNKEEAKKKKAEVAHRLHTDNAEKASCKECGRRVNHDDKMTHPKYCSQYCWDKNLSLSKQEANK